MRDRCILKEHTKRMELIEWKIKNARLEYEILSSMRKNINRSDSGDEFMNRIQAIHHVNDADVSDIFDV